VELIAAIGAGPVALDTSVFIYFIEGHPLYLPLLRPLFTRIDEGRLAAFTSTLTLLETLVVPYRSRDQSLATKYEAILTNGRGLTLVALDPGVIRAAAQIRAVTGVRTADALQLASAVSMKCAAFVTNDRRLPAIGGMTILQLDAFAKKS
jgi:predicted nucleic acid-binding protein